MSESARTLPLRIGGQTIHEMSETQLKNLLPEFEKKPAIYNEIIRVLQIKSKCRREDARNKFRADEDFIKDNF